MKITWPWEKRSSGGTNSSYTDALIRTIVAQAGATVANPAATGALFSRLRRRTGRMTQLPSYAGTSARLRGKCSLSRV